jgi:DNA polymerase elongation subunit (family B)
LRSKKRYVMMSGDTIIPKGIDIVRRDRAKLISSRILSLCRTLMMEGVAQDIAVEVAKLRNRHIVEIERGSSELSQCSIIVRREGVVRYEYTGTDECNQPVKRAMDFHSTEPTLVVKYHAMTMIGDYIRVVDGMLDMLGISSLLKHMSWVRRVSSLCSSTML